jgi:Skp family chaperone for outer membrane proteins
MNRWSCLVLFAAVALTTAVVAQDTKPLAAPPRVGVVDLGALFDGYPRRATLEDVINAERKKVRAEIEEYTNEVHRLRREHDQAEEAKADVEELQRKRDHMRLAQLELEQVTERHQARLKRRIQTLTHQLTRELTAAIAEAARKEGLGLVLKKGDEEQPLPDDEGVYRAQVADVLFREEALDFTAAVARHAAKPEFLARMEQAAKEGAPPGGKKF